MKSRLIFLGCRYLKRQNVLIYNGFQRNFYTHLVKRAKVNLLSKDDQLRLKRDLEYEKKIVYNEVLYKENVEKKRLQEIEKQKRQEERVQAILSNEYTPSISIKYLSEDKIEHVKKNEEESSVHFPFKIEKSYVQRSYESLENERGEEAFSNNLKDDCVTLESLEEPVSVQSPNKYINEHVFMKDDLEDDSIPYDIRYGTADSNIPPSSVPCGGCGAHLHCTDMSIPGFLPKEVFTELSPVELRSVICQRCHFIKEYDMPLGVNVSNEEYPRIISEIRHKKALAVIIIDLLDFPCSVWPNILEIIGSRPVVIVGNKIDLFMQDGPWFIDHITKCLLQSLEEVGFSTDNVRHVALISAKTGYGIESLISKLNKYWGTQGDIYLIGCTNAGKSTLFNQLIKSDLCKTKAVNVIQRATTSNWPGTTLNLLKFPIMWSGGMRIAKRAERLIRKSSEQKVIDLKRKKNFEKNEGRIQYTLEGSVELTKIPEEEEAIDPFNDSVSIRDVKNIGLNPNDADFLQSKWCYDTPGVVHPAQIINILHTAELVKVLPKEMILPRIFRLKPGNSLFIGGLARLDYVSGSSSALFSVFASKELPITITRIQNSKEVYERLLGTHYFVVPIGNEERLKMWPELKSEKLEVTGKYAGDAAADVVLSSAGWVTVTTNKPAEYCKLEAWTPEGRGIFIREPAVIKKASTFKGEKISGTPAFTNIIKIKDITEEEVEEENSKEVSEF